MLEHGGKENGKLPITYADLERWGVRADSIAGAIRTLESLGLIEITRHGYAGAAGARAPNLFRITYIAAWNAGRTDATGTHEYLKIKTIEEAEAVAQVARKAIDSRNAIRSRKSKRHPANCVDFAPQNEG